MPWIHPAVGKLHPTGIQNPQFTCI